MSGFEITNDEFQSASNPEQQLEQLSATLRSRPSLADAVLTELEVQSTAVSEDNPFAFDTNSWFGGGGVWRRISVGGLSIGSAAALLIVGLYLTVYSPGSSLAQATARIAAATSYSADVAFLSNGRELATGRFSWQAPDGMRVEHIDNSDPNRPQKTTDIRFKSKRGLSIDHVAKSYVRKKPEQGHSSPLCLIHQLGSYAGAASKVLGQATIAGVDCEGYEIPAIKIDPDAQKGTLTLWVSTADALPRECTISLESGGESIDMKISNFIWNRHLDPKLFSTTPPEGYAERIPEKKTPDEITQRIVEGLAYYAKMNGGRYPQVKVVYGDVTRDKLFELAGFTGKDISEYFQEESYHLIMKAGHGFAHMNQIMRHDADAEYHGLTVTPDDNEKVLFRWTLDNGEHRVIYGDLQFD